jgi:hypothetical protein
MGTPHIHRMKNYIVSTKVLALEYAKSRLHHLSYIGAIYNETAEHEKRINRIDLPQVVVT